MSGVGFAFIFGLLCATHATCLWLGRRVQERLDSKALFNMTIERTYYRTKYRNARAQLSRTSVGQDAPDLSPEQE